MQTASQFSARIEVLEAICVLAVVIAGESKEDRSRYGGKRWIIVVIVVVVF
jgi:hypothetical protein